MIRCNRITCHFHTQRIVTVQLNQAVKCLYIFPSHKRCKKGLQPAILIDIPEVSVSLGKEFRQHGEIIVIAFEISMFSGVYMKNLAVSEWNRIASAQQIIHIRVCTVGVKIFISRVRLYIFGQLLHQLLTLFFFLCKIGPI